MRKLLWLVLAFSLLSVAYAQTRVIPFTVVEIECGSVAGEEMEDGDIIRSRGQSDWGMWFSDEPMLNGKATWTVDWDYYVTPDRGTFVGNETLTPSDADGTIVITFSGYWDAEGGGSNGSGYGTGEFAEMQWSSTGVGFDFDAALAMIQGDARVVDGNPCYPDAIPEEPSATMIYGQLMSEATE